MVYRYFNKYTDEEILFDAVKLEELTEDEIPDDEEVRDMEELNLRTPYPYDVLVDTDDLLIITKKGRVSIWFCNYSYEFRYDEALIFNNEMMCGLYEMMYNNIYLEYLLFKNMVVEFGLGLKYGGIHLYPSGRMTYNKEHYSGEYMTKLDFKLQH